MFPIRTILHPTDFSEQSRAAFDLACALARDHHASLHVLHVVPLSIAYGEAFVLPLVPGATEQLKQHLEQLNPWDPAVSFSTRLLEGDPSGEILAVAREIPCDLIVMGTHGRTGLGRLLMGSIAEQVVRKAACPVLTVKMPFALAEKPEVSCSQPAPVS